MRLILRPLRLAGLPSSLLWITMLAVSASFAQSPAPLVQNVINRTTVSLDGDWHYIVDPHEEGTARRYYLNGKPFGNRNFVEYDFNTSPSLHVPGDWNFQRPELQCTKAQSGIRDRSGCDFTSCLRR